MQSHTSDRTLDPSLLDTPNHDDNSAPLDLTGNKNRDMSSEIVNVSTSQSWDTPENSSSKDAPLQNTPLHLENSIIAPDLGNGGVSTVNVTDLACSMVLGEGHNVRFPKGVSSWVYLVSFNAESNKCQLIPTVKIEGESHVKFELSISVNKTTGEVCQSTIGSIQVSHQLCNIRNLHFQYSKVSQWQLGLSLALALPTTHVSVPANLHTSSHLQHLVLTCI